MSFIASPSDHPGEILWAPGITQNNHIGRRFQMPTLHSILTIIFIYGVTAMILSEYFVLQMWNQETTLSSHYAVATPTERNIVYLTCFFTLFMDLWRTGLNGISHEINPKQYIPKAPKPDVSFNVTHLPINLLGRLWTMITFITIVSVLAPTLSTFIVFLVTNNNHQTNLKEFLEQSWQLLGFCFATSAILISFVSLMDESCRISLCTPGCRLESIVREVKNQKNSIVMVEEEEADLVDIVVRSLTHGDFALSTQIIKKNATICDIQNSDLGVLEARRNEQASDDLEKIMLAMGNVIRIPEAPLEEDLLRYIILESIGGSLSNDRQQPFKADDRHIENVLRWIQPTKAKVVLLGQNNTSRGDTEQMDVVLVRALCAYASALGKALTKIANKPMPRHLSWTLPPAAILAAEHAVIGVARCIDIHLQNSAIGGADWRSTNLSMLIPTALNTACALRVGIVDLFFLYSRGLHHASTGPANSTSDAVMKRMMTQHPELMKVINACEYLATIILQPFLLSERNSIKSIETSLTKTTYNWVVQDILPRNQPTPAK